MRLGQRPPRRTRQIAKAARKVIWGKCQECSRKITMKDGLMRRQGYKGRKAHPGPRHRTGLDFAHVRALRG